MATLGMTLAIAGLMAAGLACAAGGSAATGKSDKTADKPIKAAKAGKPPAMHAATGAFASPGPGRMQVDEPKMADSPNSAKEPKDWQKNHARGLTQTQKQAFRVRKEKMEGMIAVIKEKRKAMASAKPEQRAVIARELHTLILAKDPENGSPSGAGSDVAAARMALDAPASREDKAPGKDGIRKTDAAEAPRRLGLGEKRQKPERKEEPRKLQSGSK